MHNNTSDENSLHYRTIRVFHKAIGLFAPRERWKLVVLTGLLVIAALVEMVGVGLVVPIIAAIDQPDILSTNTLMRSMYEFSGTTSTHDFVVWCCTVLIAFYLLKNIYLGVVAYWQSRFLSQSEARASTRLLNNYLSMPYTTFLQRNPSQMVSNITIETSNLFTGLVKPAFIVLSDTLIVFGILALLCYVAPLATLAAATGLGLSALTFYVVLRRPLLKLGRERHYHRNKMVQWTNQSLNSLKELLILGRKDFFRESFKKHALEMRNTQTFYETVVQLPRLVIETFGVVTLLLITMVLLQHQEHFLPTLSLFAMAAFRLMPAAQRITACATKVRYYVQTLHVISDDMHAVPSEAYAASPDTRINFIHELVLSDIYYSYEGTNKPILNGLNIRVEKGNSVGVIGPSGEGKTTLVDIMLGLLKPDRGSVCVDGIDIHQNLPSWRSHISYMPQVIYLMDDTIRRNIAFGVPDSEVNEQQLQNAIEQAQLGAFIKNQPKGLDTEVGERGIRMSGGQRQRIGIARALYNQPEILILDEATTGLDPKTENAICETLNAMKQHLTMVIISHQPALAAIADTVYALEGGIAIPQKKT